MKVNLFDNKGKESSQTIELDESVFKAKINKQLLTQYVYVHLSNHRQGNAQVKDRGEVRGGGRKPWRQKGTGRARHGSTRSPIWKGGGITFGPTTEVNHKKGFNKKMLKKAFQSAFSLLLKNKQVKVFSELALPDGKTSSLLYVLDKAGLAKKTLVIQKKAESNLLKASRNIKNVDFTVVNEINPYLLLNYQQLVIIADVLPTISRNWGRKSEKQAVKAKTGSKSEVKKNIKAEEKSKEKSKEKPVDNSVKKTEKILSKKLNKSSK